MFEEDKDLMMGQEWMLVGIAGAARSTVPQDGLIWAFPTQLLLGDLSSPKPVMSHPLIQPTPQPQLRRKNWT